MASFINSIFEKEYAEDDDKEKTRTVGLELETTITNPKSAFFSKNRRITLREYIETHHNYCDTRKEFELYSKQEPNAFAGFGYDGNELEFVTHPDSITLYKQGGSKRFKECMRFLRRNSKPGEETLNSGTHINIGKLAGDEEDYIMDNAYWICLNFAKQIQKIAGRVTHWAQFRPYKSYQEKKEIHLQNNITISRTTKPTTVGEANKKMSKGDILVLKEHTYEFRAFKATNNINEALAWVELCHNIIMLASGQRALKDIKFEHIIQGKYINKYANNLTKQRKLTELEKAATIDNTLQFEFYTVDDETTILL